MNEQEHSLRLLTPPYAVLEPLEATQVDVRRSNRGPGSCMVWSMGTRANRHMGALVRSRPGGTSLIIVLPLGEDLESSSGLAVTVHHVRPQGILPHHPEPNAADLAQVLRRPPGDLGAEVMDYLRWRGFVIDRETVHLVRRVLDLSSELRSVSSVARSLYVSRRALGRRLQNRGLPVPSHWLQLGRLLRVATRLQNSEATVSSVAFEHGYPDGFSLSNQMERLIGHRPSDVREWLGWEWLVESWLQREAAGGRLRPTVGPGPASEFDLPRDRHDRAAAPRRQRSKAREVRD